MVEALTLKYYPEFDLVIIACELFNVVKIASSGQTQTNFLNNIVVKVFKGASVFEA